MSAGIKAEIVEFRAFVNDLRGESDRAAVILGAAKLDLLLFQLLGRVLKPSTGRTDDLLEGDSPLGTFSARAMIAYRLGLISDEVYRAINLIRRIRNSFAHELSGVSLSSGSHCDRVKELIAPMHEHPAYKWISNEVDPEGDGPAFHFRVAVALISVRLQGAFEQADIVYSKEPSQLLPPEWDAEVNKIQTKRLEERAKPAKRPA